MHSRDSSTAVWKGGGGGARDADLLHVLRRSFSLRNRLKNPPGFDPEDLMPDSGKHAEDGKQPVSCRAFELPRFIYRALSVAKVAFLLSVSLS